MTARRGNSVLFLAAFTLLVCCPCDRACSQQPSGQEKLDWKNADAILRAAVPRTLQSRRESMAYTYAVDYQNRNFTPTGKVSADYEAKYEVIFLEGLPYRRQIEENHRSLNRKQAADEAKRYDQAFSERSRMSVDQKRDYLRKRWNFDIPLPQLVPLFANHVLEEETVAGRPAVVIESLPRADLSPSDEEGQRALHKRVKLWIDREDLIVSRIEAILVTDDASMKKGTVARIDFARQSGGTWLPSRSDVQFQTMDGLDLVRGETIESNRNFQRFHVDVRLLDPTSPDGHSQAQ